VSQRGACSSQATGPPTALHSSLTGVLRRSILEQLGWQPMPVDPSISKAVLIVAILAMAAIRGPHVRRSLKIPVVKSLEGVLEKTLVACVLLSLLLTIVWISTPILSFADYPLTRTCLVAGTACLVAGLWLLHRSHSDLGTSW
jgi:hypothetical protein